MKTHSAAPALFAAVLGAVAAGILSSCASSLPASLQTRRYDIGGSPDAVRIVHISDLHARRYGSLAAELARRVREIGPDLILITGDTVTSPSDYAVAERVIAGLGDEVPKLAVRGNWDLGVDADPARLAALMEAHGGRLLVNERCALEIKGLRILAYGVDDMLLGRFVPPRAWQLGPEAGEAEFDAVFLLCHEPAFVDVLERDILELKEIYAFSGHTHGGQVTFLGKPLTLPEGSGRYVSGEYRVGSLRLFVSRGVGTSRLDLRIFARPDIMVYGL